MKVIYDSRLLSDENVALSSTDRAFCYGDGLFETIVTGPERLNLLDFHIERLAQGCKALGLEMPNIGSADLWYMIHRLSKENGIEGDIRSRLQVWRKPGGKYCPETTESTFLLRAEPNQSPSYSYKNRIGISKTTRVQKTGISFAKTMSALPYVMASREKDISEFDELIILDAHGHIAETTSANIFWVIDGVFYTPSLESGAIAGVMRRHLLQTLKRLGHTCEEVVLKPEVLSSAKHLFTTNASGITWMKTFENNTYQDPIEILGLVIRQPQQP